jgi:hypothetical protein
MTLIYRTKYERIMARLEPASNDECWLWPGYTQRGYGYVNPGREGGTPIVHRAVYEHHHGPVASTLHVEHVCHTNDSTCAGGVTCSHRRCANPAHLEVVTPRENNARKHSAPVEFCRHGHEFTSENTYYTNAGGRQCRTCQRESAARYRERLRTERGTTTHYNTAKRFCKRGHEFTPENTYILPSGAGRNCKECERERQRKRRKE